LVGGFGCGVDWLLKDERYEVWYIGGDRLMRVGEFEENNNNLIIIDILWR